ncbi:MAG: MBL fold metallo-hydrolase [Spirosomataceae bacterium]
MIQLKAFVFNPFQENTYLVWDETKEALIIDPGCSNASERRELSDFIADEGLNPVRLLNTHGHIDHVLGNFFVQQRYGLKLHIHAKDVPVLKAVKTYAPNYGFPDYQEVEPEGLLNEGDVVVFGNSSFEVLFVPGHAPGHVVFVNHEQHICLGGDVLFRGSVGRTDLPGGNFDTLVESIQQKLFTLADDMTVYPGHGPSTTIGYEKKWNPFVGESAL